MTSTSRIKCVMECAVELQKSNYQNVTPNLFPFYGHKQIIYRGHRGRVIVHKNNVELKLVSDIDLDVVKPQRAGVILYTIKDGQLVFGLGVDSRSQDLTDFGGGVSYRTDLSAVNGALREFDEESLRIIDPLTAEQVQNCPVLYDTHNMIIFILLDVDIDVLSSMFDVKHDKYVAISGTEPEVSKIVWLSESEFRNAIKYGNRLFSRVQNFLKRAGDFFIIL